VSAWEGPVLTDEEAAVVAYEANRGYNHVIGDPWLDPPWPGLPQWYREAVIDGVRAVRAGLDPQQLHEHWCAYYRRLGWVHGPVKDADASPPTHPCLVPYEALPAAHQRKNILFREFVLAMSRGR
jgi:hypothetical protein